MFSSASAGSPEAVEPGLALRRSAAWALCAGAVGLLLLGAALSLAARAHGAELGLSWALKAALIYAVAARSVWAGLPMHAPHARFGPANGVTLLRLLMIVGLAAAIGEASLSRDARTPTLAWVLVGLASLAAALDALDGALARRSGMASDFGARFDMESDALLIMVLSVWVWLWGQAGAWVLLSGAMRYVFVAAAWRWPWLAHPLPPRWRRKAVCVAQIASLLIALLPVLAPPLSSAVAALGLLLLCGSFALDVWWLARRSNLVVEPRS